MASLQAVIQESQNFLLILTEGTLTNKWCLIELAEAVSSGKNIVLVIREGARWPDPDAAGRGTGLIGAAGDAAGAAAGPRTLRFPAFSQLVNLSPEVQVVFRLKPVEHAEQYLKAFVQDLLVRIKLSQTPQQQQHREPRRVGPTPAPSVAELPGTSQQYPGHHQQQHLAFGGGGGGGGYSQRPSGTGYAPSHDGGGLHDTPEESFQAMQAEVSDKRSLSRAARRMSAYGAIASGERPFSSHEGGGMGGRPWTNHSAMGGGMGMGMGGGVSPDVLQELASMRDAQMRTAATLQALAEIQTTMLQTQQETLRASLAAQQSLHSLVSLMRQNISPGRAFRDRDAQKAVQSAKENVAASVVAQVNALRAALSVPEITITTRASLTGSAGGGLAGAAAAAAGQQQVPMYQGDEGGGVLYDDEVAATPRRVATAIGSERARRGGQVPRGSAAAAASYQMSRTRGRPLPPIPLRERKAEREPQQQGGRPRSRSPGAQRRSPSPPSAWPVGAEATPGMPLGGAPSAGRSGSGGGAGGAAAAAGSRPGSLPATQAERSAKAFDSLSVSPETSNFPLTAMGGGSLGAGNPQPALPRSAGRVPA